MATHRFHTDTEVLRASTGQHFRATELKTQLADVGTRDPIAISKIASQPGLTRGAATAGYSVPVLLTPLAQLTLSIDGVRTRARSVGPGDILLVDLSADPWSHTDEAYGFLRFFISQRTMDDLAYDRGERAPSALRSLVGAPDPVLYELARATLYWTAAYGPEDCLFTDHVALAFHAHLVATYGQVAAPALSRGGLAPWQVRRVREMMLSELAGQVKTKALAEACGLSLTYFGRAFRDTMGAPPHKWLMEERLRRAKHLLRHSNAALPEIAAQCGFADHSHMTRAFARKEGQTPARWRRLARD